jgi:glycosyltransferase involved in cell wall biosynthesis
LRGAIETIRRDKPILLISIYHNASDFLDIKPMIESWNLGYRFQIYHPPIKSISGETVLIAECIRRGERRRSGSCIVPELQSANRSVLKVCAEAVALRNAKLAERDAARRKALEMRAERDAQRETARQKIADAQAERDASRQKAAEMRAERDAERETIRKELERYREVNDRDNYSLFARMALVRLRKEPILPSDNARISVIIPVHNAEKDINDCLASVFSVKEASDIEVICVDDGSADDSVELIQEWAGVAPNLRVVSNDGQGIEAARKTGLSVAKGTKIVFLDPSARLLQNSALLHVQGESDIKPAFAENNIPIVATTDENYLEYTKVLLRSIIATTSCNIDFLIFHEGIAEEKRREFAECFSRQENLSVRFVDMAEHVKSSKDAGFADKRYPVSTCFRVYAPYVLTEYEKAVYLDIDTIVCRDISELYNADLGDSLMGCVVDVVNSSSKAAYASFARMHGFVEWDKYFNAGVLLMNFKAFRYCGMLDSLLKIIIEASKREFFPDQDALNFVCKGRVKYLDPRWHVQLGDYCLREQLALTGDEIWIAHFTAGQKPWNFPLRCFSNLWWRHVCCEEGLNLWRKASGDNPQVAIGDGIAASVVIPIYNAESYLAQTLISYCVQTLRNIEIICIDDGSTDGSRAICEKFASLDSRIRILSQKNLGAAVARNRGIEESRGRWLFFGDADDFCRHDMLEELVRAGQNDCHDVVVAGRMIMDCGRSMQVREVGVPRGYFGKGRNVNCHTDGINVFAGLGFAPWNKLFRRAFVIEKGIKFHNNPSCDDVFFVFSSLIAAESIAFVDKSYYYYRANLPTSQMGLADKNPTNFLIGLREIKSLLDGESLRLKEQFYCAAVHSCFDHLFALKTSEGRRITFAALQNGGLESLCFPQIDSRTFDLGSIRRVFDLTVSGGSLADVIAEHYQANCAKTADLTARLETAQSSVAKLNARMEELNMAAKRRDEWLAAEKKKVAKRDERVSALQAQLEQRNQAVAKCNEWLAAEKAKVAKRDERVSALQVQLEQRNQAVAKCNEWLAAEKAKVAKRDERVSALQAQLEQRNQAVAKCNEWLAAEKAKVAKREERILALREQVGIKQRQVEDRDNWLNQLKMKVASYKEGEIRYKSEIVDYENRLQRLQEMLTSIGCIVKM